MSENEVKKESMLKKVLKVSNKIPKIGKTIILVAMLMLFVYVGLTISSSLRTRTASF